MPENNFEYGFSNCKNVSNGSIFPEKNLNCTLCITEYQSLKFIQQICLVFNFKAFGFPPLHMKKAYSIFILFYLLFFLHNYFISE